MLDKREPARKDEGEKLVPYLAPLTLAEVVYSQLTTGDYTGENSYRYLCQLDGIPDFDQILTSQFTTPPNIADRINSGEGILNIISGIHADPGTLAVEEGGYPRIISIDYLRWMLEALSPQRTFHNRTGDCKSLAVVSVLVARSKSVPSRLICSQDDHMVHQQYFGDQWHTFDSQAGHIVIGRKVPNDYDEYYRKVIGLFST